MPTRAEATVTEIKPAESGPVTETLEIPGRGIWKFRELTVDENDACREGAMSKDKNGQEVFNGRTMIRLMIVASSVEPKISLKDLSNLPQRVYARIVNFVNDLNDEASLEPKDEDLGNS